MSHSHDHELTATGRNRGRLVVVAALTSAMFVVEVIGGLASGSLALLADAAHLLTDSAGLVIALIAALLAARPATKRRTFGLRRAEILAAGLNALLLLGIGASVLVNAIQRFGKPAEISTGLMLWVAIAGTVVNLIGLAILRGGRTESLNLRGAYLEALGDLLGSLAVILAAIVIQFTGWTAVDSIAALAVFAMILPRAWSLLREVADVLLEATPEGIDLDDVRTHLLGNPEVVGVHDLHAWTITSGAAVLSAHVVVSDDCVEQGRTCDVLDELNDCLDDHFALSHCTLQLETSDHAGHEHPQHA